MLRAVNAPAVGAAILISVWSGGQSIANDAFPFSHSHRGGEYAAPFVPAHTAVGAAYAPSNPLVALGQRLFFDTRLSGTGGKACASCHLPRYVYAEPRWVAISDNGKLGRRNVPSLVDVAFSPWLMWDGRFPSLEQQAFGPFASGEMGIPIEEAARRVNGDPQYASLFRAALGSFATPVGIAQALAAYERTLVSPPSRVDRFLEGDPHALSAIERDGYEVFTRRAGCANCHQVYPTQAIGSPGRRALFTDFQFHNLGVGYRSGFADTGRHEQSRSPSDWGAFRTPSLRHSAKSPPYMHDGSFNTLNEVVEFYNAGGIPNPNLSPQLRPLGLSSHEKSALVAFLRAIAD